MLKSRNVRRSEENMEWVLIVEAVMMLLIWSFLYRESLFYRLGEHILIGIYLGFSIYMGIDVLLKRVFVPLLSGNVTVGLALSIILGFLFYTRYVKPVSFMSRWSVAVLTGCGSAVAVSGAIKAMIVGQLPQGSWFAEGITGFNNFVMSIATVFVIVYFLFTFKPTRLLKSSAKFGRFWLMICFGVMLGTFLLSNIGYPIGMAMKLLTPPALYVTIIAILLIAADALYRRIKGT